MQRRTQMNLQLQQHWRHDGEEPEQTPAPVKSRLPRKPAKRRPPVTVHNPRR
jgi:hypothetical protein